MTETIIEQAVRDRYAAAARERETDLCCPTSYDRRYLEILPAEIVERDYGCGNPWRHIREGQTALDLGSESGMICYIAAQIVGPAGRVIGIDMNDEMLALSRRHQSGIARRLGYDNVTFLRGRIQDLRTDSSVLKERLRPTRPLVADESIDLVLLNCVLNLVPDRDKPALFREIRRVLRKVGRAVVSDIVSNAPVPEDLKRDPKLWSGCVREPWKSLRSSMRSPPPVSTGSRSSSAAGNPGSPWMGSSSVR